MDEAAEKVMAVLESEGADLSLEQYVELCEEVASRARTNADAAREDMRRQGG